MRVGVDARVRIDSEEHPFVQPWFILSGHSVARATSEDEKANEIDICSRASAESERLPPSRPRSAQDRASKARNSTSSQHFSASVGHRRVLG